MLDLSDSSMYMTMVLLILGLAYVVGLAFLAIVIIWVKGYCGRLCELSEQSF
jgi:hypothetical protein